ncbi:MAG: GtrA family protein [Bacteroidales bacterium]|nr:GtrA family protein [Bacteroidales bacterium]
MRFRLQQAFSSGNNSVKQKTLVKYFLFLLVGLPAFIIAIPLNYLLVEFFHLYKPAAYLIVLLLQVTINFFMLRWFVFKTSKDHPILKQYLLFLGGIGIVRLMDLGCYTLFVEVFGFYYLLVQLANVVVFSVIKFLFSKTVMEKKSTVSNKHAV